ncbi:MAG: recombinase family protein [bacterium]|nr:recombinase family protein [bacterium]
MNKAVAYYRTSSVSNVGQDKDSKKRQHAACFSYAAKAGLNIVSEFYDANVSGKDAISSRAGFSQLLTYCEANEVQSIVFETANRLSRDQITQELGYRELRGLGYNLICADAPEYFTDDTDNPSVKMIRQMLGVVAEFQKDEIVLKLKGARDRKRAINEKAGIVTVEGRGKVEGRRSYRETNPELIREVKRLARKSPKTGKKRSLREISRELAASGYLNGKGKPFAAVQVQRLLG